MPQSARSARTRLSGARSLMLPTNTVVRRRSIGGCDGFSIGRLIKGTTSVFLSSFSNKRVLRATCPELQVRYTQHNDNQYLYEHLSVEMRVREKRDWGTRNNMYRAFRRKHWGRSGPNRGQRRRLRAKCSRKWGCLR